MEFLGELLYNIWAINPAVMSLIALIPAMFIGYATWYNWTRWFGPPPSRPQRVITDASDHLQRPVNPHDIPPPPAQRPSPRVWGVDKE